MPNGKIRFKERIKKTKGWIKWFKEHCGREPTKEEGLAFGTGFNTGWGCAKKRADKLHSRQNLDIVDSSGTGQQN